MAKGIAHREWRITAEDYEDDRAFRKAVQAELAMCENIGERLGVAIVAAPIRTKAKHGSHWFTVGWVFQTASIPAMAVEQPGEIDALEDALATVPDVEAE